MKKIMALAMALCLVLSFTACSKNSMNYIIDNMPSFKGVVTEFCEDEYIVVDTNADLKINEKFDIITVSLDVENADSMTNFDIGDEVAVYYGMVYEDEDGINRLDTVYAILLVEPANRDKNNMS